MFYMKNKIESLKIKIFKRQVCWLRRLLQLNEATSSQKALLKACQNMKHSRGISILTWFKLVISNLEKLSSIEVHFRDKDNSIWALETLASNKNY